MTSSGTHAPARAGLSRRVLRVAWLAIAWAAGALFAIAVGDVLYSSSLAPLRPWHTIVPGGEFVAAQDRPDYGFDDYLAQEARLFDAVRALREAHYDPARDTAISRFAPDRGPYAARLERDWNRSARLDAAAPRGVALLVHGLSDSPYSMRALALALQRAGVTVYLLRLPGHGTLPSALDDVDWRDWLAAVSLTARQIRRDHADLPFWYVGYSTGAALGVKFSADAVRSGRTDLLPARLFLMSPAIGVSPFAKLANVQRLISRWGLMPKARWTDVELEIDPFKYQSFAKNAGAQIASLTASVQRELAAMDRDGSIVRFPPVTAFQSMVDATVVTGDLATRFFGLLRGGASELLLYGVNRRSEASALVAFSPEALMHAFEHAPRREYRLIVLGNADGTRAIVERRWEPGAATPIETPLPLAWPESVFSLSHVAVPFPPDDPIYGLAAPRAADGLPSLGALALRGESGALAIGPAAQLRLRSNPFFDDMAGRILLAIEAQSPRR